MEFASLPALVEAKAVQGPVLTQRSQCPGLKADSWDCGLEAPRETKDKLKTQSANKPAP